MDWFRWRPYVPVAARRSRAKKKMENLRKKGMVIQPVEIQGRKIARTFWGLAWCDHLEKFSDYENRLPRGRTYVRNGAVCHLEIAKGKITAMVSGSALYDVKIEIKALPRKKWNRVKDRCAGQVGSLLELLQGRISRGVMTVVTDRDHGLFPLPREISLGCSCPDWAVMCKHVAATLYGMGARLDEKPELLFLLRGVDHEELISSEVGAVAAAGAGKGDGKGDGRARIADEDISDVFGIEIAKEQPPAAGKAKRRRGRATGSGSRAGAASRGDPERRGKRAGKKPAAERPDSERPSRKAQTARPITGRTVARLRARFGMSKSEFAMLLGVSAASVGNWEKTGGRLNLQRRTLEALSSAKELTKGRTQRRTKESRHRALAR